MLDVALATSATFSAAFVRRFASPCSTIFDVLLATVGECCNSGRVAYSLGRMLSSQKRFRHPVKTPNIAKQVETILECGRLAFAQCSHDEAYNDGKLSNGIDRGTA